MRFSIIWTSVRESVVTFMPAKKQKHGLEKHSSHSSGGPALLRLAALNLHVCPQYLAFQQFEKNKIQITMEAKNKSMYETPATEVVEVKVEGIVCESLTATRNVYDSNSLEGYDN